MSDRVVPHEVRAVFTGRVFTVTIESVTLPGGSTLDMEIVHHPGSVVMVPLTDDGQLILVRQYRHAIGAYAWELPAGTLEAGERVEAAAVRECQEETGMVAAAVEPLGTLYPTPGYCDESMTFYRMTGLRLPRPGEPRALPDEDESIETGTFSPGQVRDMIRQGAISDMKTVAGLLLAGV
ncbi:MAG: NUDIX hydrolase [Acidobacteria bacterium]|nr:NUDIX hydrolase [Acidobacteriota bacterium]